MLDRSIKPEATGNIKFEIPEIEKFTLSNGLKIFLVRKESLPIIQFNFMVNAGSKTDPGNKSGLAYLTALLIDEGAGHLSALELDNEVESLGSILKISCDHDSFTVTMLTLKENLNKSFNIFSDIILKPRFEEDDFNREHKKLLSKIIQSGNEPTYIADSVFEKLIFEDTFYKNPTLGIQRTVENIANNDVKEFHQRKFFAENSTLVAVGNISKEEIISICSENLQMMKSGDEQDENFQSSNLENGKIYLIHKEGAAQSEIRVGHITNDRKNKDYYSKLLMNTILGGQFSSRLNSNLREIKGFTYGISSGFYYNKFSGQFEISTAVQSENTGAALIEIYKEINGIKENILSEEVEFAKSYLIKRFPSQFETYSQVSRQLATLVHYDLPDNYFNKYIENIESTTHEQIFDAAKNYIHSEKLKTVLVGDKNIILDQLQNFDAEIIELNKDGELINR